MKKIGDYVVYRKEVCKIVNIKEKYMKDIDYYSLVPIDDESLHLDVPTTIDNQYLRDLINKEQVEELIKIIPQIKPIETIEKNMENEYKKLINSDNLEDYIKIIKTTYLRNQERIDNKRKISDKDEYYFNLAEKYLYNEFRIVLNMTFDEIKEYITTKVKSLVNY